MKVNYKEVRDERCENCVHFKITWACPHCHEDETEMPPTPLKGGWDKLRIRNDWMDDHEVNPNGICDDYRSIE